MQLGLFGNASKIKYIGLFVYHYNRYANNMLTKNRERPKKIQECKKDKDKKMVTERLVQNSLKRVNFMGSL